MKNDLSSLLETTSGKGQCSLSGVSLRRSVTSILIASVLSGCAALSNPESIKLEIPGNTRDFKSRLYAGAALGSSTLKPDTRATAFSVDSDSDMGTQLRLGYDVHNMLSVEVDTSVLGASTLRERNTDVQYSAASVSALIYGWSGVQNRSRREGLSAYGRLGYASVSRSSAVVTLEESGFVPIIGIGAEYGFTNGLGIRADITRFDSDAMFLGFGAIYRFGISPSGIGRIIAEAAEPALPPNGTRVASRDANTVEAETVVERYAGPGARPVRAGAPNLHYTSGAEPNTAYVGSMADRWRPAMRADDRDTDGVLDNVDSCPDTKSYVTVDRYGCGLFDAVLHEVTFKTGSRWLTPRARAQLDLLADTLMAFPEARVQVRAHTDSQGAADANLGLSSRRAEVVVQYLQSRGVHELQLQAVGMGEAQPLDSNSTKQGRKRNRRVDVVTLPDQDAGQLLVAANVESGAVMSVQNQSGVEEPGSLAKAVGDQWNSAPRFTPKPKSADIDTAAEPGLLAAKPAAQQPSDKTRSVVKKAGTSAALSNVAPLPHPGHAPNFQIDGVLTNVKFARGEDSLSSRSQDALKHLLRALKDNPSVKVAVMAHTDSRGSIAANKALSTVRAQAVVNYLVDGGIDAGRLRAEGYGELLPLVQNVTEADRERNRRIEIRVLPSES